MGMLLRRHYEPQVVVEKPKVEEPKEQPVKKKPTTKRKKGDI